MHCNIITFTCLFTLPEGRPPWCSPFNWTELHVPYVALSNNQLVSSEAEPLVQYKNVNTFLKYEAFIQKNMNKVWWVSQAGSLSSMNRLRRRSWKPDFSLYYILIPSDIWQNSTAELQDHLKHCLSKTCYPTLLKPSSCSFTLILGYNMKNRSTTSELRQTKRSYHKVAILPKLLQCGIADYRCSQLW